MFGLETPAGLDPPLDGSLPLVHLIDHPDRAIMGHPHHQHHARRGPTEVHPADDLGELDRCGLDMIEGRELRVDLPLPRHELTQHLLHPVLAALTMFTAKTLEVVGG